MDANGAVDHLVTQGFTRAAVYSVTGADFAAQGGDWQAGPSDIRLLIDGFSDPDNVVDRNFTINDSQYTLEVRDETLLYCPSDAHTILFAHKNGESIVLGEFMAGALSLKDAELNIKEVAYVMATKRP